MVKSSLALTCIFISANSMAADDNREGYLTISPNTPLGSQIRQRIEIFKEIVAPGKADQVRWWIDKYGVEFESEPVREDSFYRWSGIQVLNIAQGDINGIEPVPKVISDEIFSYLKAWGYSNAATGKTQSLKGRSQHLKDAGVEHLKIERYFDGDAISTTSKKPLLHVSFQMILYTASVQGSITHVYPSVDSNEQEYPRYPLANYERMIVDSSEDFVVLAVENIVFEKKKCMPTQILLGQCMAIEGVFSVDYFHIEE